jgi:hypothetical protein
MWPSAPASTNERPDTIELHAFAGAARTSFLQEDDGLTLGGPTRRTWFELDGETLRARSEGEFPGSRFAVVAHGGRVELIA